MLPFKTPSVHKNRIVLITVSLFVVQSSDLFAQADACATATVVGSGAFGGDTTTATNDGEASCGESNTSADVWFRFTPPADCLLTVDTCVSAFDTVLSLHSACPGNIGNELACSDDVTTCGTSSIVQLPAIGGTPYLIRVGGWQGASGTFVLNITCSEAPGADECADAAAIGTGSFPGTTIGATNDGAASCGDSETSADVWFVHTADEDCLLFIETCGATWDTVVSVHSGCPGTIGNELACSDDACGTQSRLAIQVMAGSSYWIRVAGWMGATGTFSLDLQCAPFGGDGADVFLGELTALEQFGRVGDVVGCAIDSPLCNAGTEPLDWFANPDPRHPFMVFNMYRERDGRFEQIGQSWVKHGFGAAQENACGLGCIPHPDSTRLGVGCSDTYSVGLNAVQSIMGPRSEINPWTGGFVFEGSHMDTHTGGHDAIEHRLQIHDDDLDPAMNPGAAYHCELYILAHDDAEHMNSVVHEPVGVSGAPGGAWDFDICGSNTGIGPAITAWTGAAFTTIPESVTGDGRCILGVRAEDNGDGTWHYEYALYNHDMDRQVQSLFIPVSSETTVNGADFHAVPSAGESYNNDPWTFTRDAAGVTWSTTPINVDPASNPLRWGTMYNFRFDADAPPTATIATLGLYKPGTPTALTGPTTGPTAGPVAAIPAASQWSLIAMGVLLATAGTLRFRRRTQTTPVQ